MSRVTSDTNRVSIGSTKRIGSSGSIGAGAEVFYTSISIQSVSCVACGTDCGGISSTCGINSSGTVLAGTNVFATETS